MMLVLRITSRINSSCSTPDMKTILISFNFVISWKMYGDLQIMIAKKYSYLDNDRDGFIDKRNVKFGISFVTNKNIDSDDVDRAFDTYDTDKDGKMNKREFILASMNDGFLRSVENPSITTSFFNN